MPRRELADEPMIRVDEALTYILNHIEPLPAEEVDLLDGLDRVLAEEVVADMDIPPFPNSAMDGYAVRASDTAGAGPAMPIALQVVEEVAAGAAPTVEIGPGTAARIMTGAPIPPGADAVVRFEETGEGWEASRNSNVRIYKAVSPMDNVRPAGEDIHQGQRILEAGRLLRPQELGVLASLGRPTVRVHRRPRVSLLLTRDGGTGIEQYIIPALVRRYGGVPVRPGTAPNTVGGLTAKIRAGLDQKVDLFLTSAEVYAGNDDGVKNMPAADGEMHFRQVAVNSGQPLAFGQIAGVPVLGLPGDPAAALVAFEVFARPAIRKMAGWTRLEKPRMPATLREDVASSGRQRYIQAVVIRSQAGYEVTTRGDTAVVQGPGIPTAAVWANALLVVPEGEAFLPAGSQVEVEILDWPEIAF